MVLFNFKEFAKGFILPWGSAILFAFIAINGLFELVPLSVIGSLRLINSTLGSIVIFSLIIGKPFTLQYAREEVDSKYWHSPNFIKINWILTGIWAFLMIIMRPLHKSVCSEKIGHFDEISIARRAPHMRDVP